MAQNPIISIIMNCYNAALTLSQSLDSVLAQSYKHYEIIFFDSASTDNSLAIAQNYSKHFEKMQCIAHVENITLGQARNYALHWAKGDYIAFLDCDDLWLPDKLSLQVAYMQEHPNVNLLCTDTENFYNKGKPSLGKIFTRAKPERGYVFVELIQRQWISLSSVMLRHEALRDLDKKLNFPRLTSGVIQYFDSKLSVCHEADLFYKLAYYGQFDFLPQLLTRRRIHAFNLTLTQAQLWHVETHYILQKLCQTLPNFTLDYPQLIILLKRRGLFQEAIYLWSKGEAKKARQILRHAHPSLKKGFKQKLFMLFSFFSPKLYKLAACIYLSFPSYLRQ